jgi:stage V sporulation protein R
MMSESTKKQYTPLSDSSEWSYDLLDEYYNHIERIATEKFKLNGYPNQLEIISSEGMLEAYATHAMPMYYDHWSTGMRFVEEHERYRRGMMGLAYEVVINSNPCIAYLMEENTMLMQILVMAHASFGHNHFFKNNYMFKQWTSADSIIDYLGYAKRYIRECEEMYGEEEVEEVLDACHALQYYGVDKYKRPPQRTAAQEEAEADDRRKWIQSQVNEVWLTTAPDNREKANAGGEGSFPDESVENLLYFIEKSAPNLPQWKREIIRIVRKMSQYFYPQMQTQLMNEGFATFMHYTILNEMYDEGLIGDGYMLEFLESHTNVTMQPDYNSKWYNGINVYALGFAMYKDIKRISMEPTEEDKEWFAHKEWVGNGEWLENILWAAANFKDESFVLEFLSPQVMRDFHLFSVLDDDQDNMIEISAIHNKQGYRKVREVLSNQYNRGTLLPEIQVQKGGVDRWGDRSMTLEHIIRERRPLDSNSAQETLKHAKVLWGYNVKLESTDASGKTWALYELTDDKSLLDVFIDDDA